MIHGNLARFVGTSRTGYLARPLVCGVLAVFAASALAQALAPPTPPSSVYVVLGEGAQATVRAITADDHCPELVVDSVARPMRTRTDPGTAPMRAGQARAADFPIRVCEAALPAHVQSATIAGIAVPRVRPDPQRIVVLGDTGCRIKGSEKAYQNCADPAAWPFRAIAAAAAAEQPDLVVHVGDYHYRETPCPADAGCADSPWGYGWDAWNADLFVPAQQLLAAAPWVVTRGNHEECARAGQGWFRLLDVQAYMSDRSCNVVALDEQADFSAPYAIPLGGGWQLVIFDSARASHKLRNTDVPDVAMTLAQYRHQMQRVADLAAAPGMRTIFISHHPILGFAVDKAQAPVFGNAALLGVMKSLFGMRYFPQGVELALHGHVHAFEAINFSSIHPATIVAGHGGDNLDADLPDGLPAAAAAVEGVQIESVTRASRFGYLVLEKAAGEWTVRARSLDNSSNTVCTLEKSHLACAGAAPISRPAP